MIASSFRLDSARVLIGLMVEGETMVEGKLNFLTLSKVVNLILANDSFRGEIACSCRRFEFDAHFTIDFSIEIQDKS